jgi:invasion protein IalB
MNRSDRFRFFKILPTLFFLFQFLFYIACATSDDESENDEHLSQNEGQQNENSENNSDNSVVKEVSDEKTEVKVESTAPVKPAVEPTTSLKSESSDVSRVVFYVKMDTHLYSAPNAEAKKVGMLEKGDPIVVPMTKDQAWIQLDSNVYIKLTALSKEGVGRTKNHNPWKKRARVN